MKIVELRYRIDPDGTQHVDMVVSGNCEKECAELEEALDSGKNISAYFSQDADKRSLDQNSLYWSLVARIAKATGASMSEIHNINLRRYGSPFNVDNQLVFAYLEDSPEVEKSVLQNETVHMKPTSSVREGNKGKMFRAYMIMKGSSEMTVQEMAALIDGCVSECREMGLPYKKPWEWG